MSVCTSLCESQVARLGSSHARFTALGRRYVRCELRDMLGLYFYWQLRQASDRCPCTLGDNFWLGCPLRWQRTRLPSHGG